MISTKRLQFQLLEPDHFPEILAMYAEPETNKYIRPLRGKSKEEYLKFFRFKMEQNEQGLGYFWVVLKKDGSFLGTANFNHFSPFEVEHVGVHLARAFWSRGYGTEIVEALLQFAKSEGRNVVHALVQEGHDASLQMLNKAGMQFKEKRENAGDILHIYQKQWS